MDDLICPHAAHNAEIARLMKERDQARMELATLQAKRDATLEQEVTAILDAMSVVEVEQGQARVNDTLIPALAKMMALLLLKPDGTLYNVMEWSVGSDPDIGELRLFMQRVEGKTLSDLYHEVIAERDQARADAAQYRRCLEAVAHFWRNDPLAFGDEATPGTLAGRFAEIARLCCDALEEAGR